MKKHFIFNVLFIGLMMSACSNEEPLPDNVGQQPDDAAFVSLEGDFGVTEENIGNIVKSMKGKDSRSTDYTVSTIVDSLGQPTIYVVNFKNNGGFVLVSATKSHYPILAYNDEGNYNVNALEDPIRYWQEKMVEDVTASFDMPEDSIAKYRLRWLQYETPHTRASRRLNPGEYPDHWTDEVIEIYNKTIQERMDSIARWFGRGYTVAYYWDGQFDRTQLYGYLTTEEQRQALDNALEYCQGLTWYWCEEQWQDLAVIIVREQQLNQFISNYVNSTWSQGEGFNRYYPIAYGDLYFAGCGPVAAGQIMYYHKWPPNYNWGEMEDLISTPESARLLYDITLSSNPRYDGPTHQVLVTIDNIEKTFKNMGYVSEGIRTDIKNCYQFICRNKPVFIRANSKEHSTGHAWIGSGSNTKFSNLMLEAYTLDNSRKFTRIYSKPISYYEDYYVYMNWGYGGRYDGFYSVLESNISIPGSTFNYGFKYLSVYPDK